MKKNFKTLRMAVLLVLCLAVTAIPGMASADVSKEDVTGLIQTAETTLNYTFSPTITLTQSLENEDLTITDLTVENKQGVGKIKLEGLTKYKTLSGWELEASDTDFKALPLNSRKFSLVASIGDKTCDMSKGKLQLENTYIEANDKAVIKFTGKASGSTYTKNERAILMILTISPIQEERFVKMHIGDSEYFIDYDMSWGQWLESELGKDSNFELDGTYIKEKSSGNYVYYSANSLFQRSNDIIVPDATYIVKEKD